MWKKLLILMIALAGIFTVGYAYYSKEMKAATTPFQLQKGQKVILGTYNSKEMVWDIGNNTSDYVLMSSKPIVDSIQTFNSALPVAIYPTLPSLAGRENYCVKYIMPSGSGDYYFSFCPTTTLKSEINKINTNSTENELLSRSPFLPSIADIKDGGTLGVTLKDRAFKKDIVYWVDGYISTAGYNQGVYKGLYFNVIQNSLNASGFAYDFYEFDSSNIVISRNEKIEWMRSKEWSSSGGGILKFALRPYALIDKNKVTFAANTSYTDGQWHKYKVDTSNWNVNNEINPNKLRIESSLTAAIQDIQYKAKSTQVVSKDSTVTIRVNANTGTNTQISVIAYDNAGTAIQYYRLLAPTVNGTNDYTLDLTGVAVGKYLFAVINEEYDPTSDLPVKSSAISNSLPLEIVEPLSNLTFTPQTDLQFNNNVNVGNKVGTIFSSNGAGNPTYTIVADPAYPNEYTNVTLGSDGKTVIVNGAALHAGTYHFKIQAQDQNGDPDPALEISASFTVNKTSLSVAFDDPNQTKKSIVQATAGWNETASATPSTGKKVTYSKSGGSVGLINIDPNTGAITYAGKGAYGKVTIKATADDDPSTGYDDYNPADTTKEIVIYREVSGIVTPHTNSSSTTTPTFQTSDANIKPNGVIGTIKGTLGTPDNGTSGTTTYTYGIKNIDDYNYFSVNSSTGEIKTTADLSTTTGTYNITVTVSDKWSSFEIPVMISVGLAPAENLKFYENSTSGVVIHTKSAKVTDSGVSVYATVKGSSNNNPVTYKIKDGTTNVIEVNSNSGAITIHGVGTVIIVAEKQGAGGQADAYTELTFTVTAGDQNFIYTDSTLSNELPKNGGYYTAYKETYEPSKTFQLYTTGNPTGAVVTYQLKAGSPTDVISVDTSGLVTILNASQSKDIGKVIVQATSHDPNGNYDDKTIELPINIDKGTRTIAFAENPIYVTNGTGSITPNLLVDGSIDTDGNTTIEIDPSEDNSIAWTNDGETIYYTWNDAKGKDIKLHVTKPANRNYKIAEADGRLHILGAEESALTLSTPGKVTYGDHFAIRSTQDDSMSTNVQYTFTTDNGVFISAPQVNGNKAEFDALAYSGNTEITITVTRTADGELPLSKKVKVKVLPKPITIEIEDKEKKRLEENPPLTYKDFKPQLVTWNGVQDTINESVIKLSTTAGKYSPIGTYPIIAKNAEKQLNDNYPNYTFTIKDGKLNIKDNGNKDFWDTDDDGCPDLNIKITDDKGNTITINGDMNEDGIPDYNIDTNGDGKPDLNIDTDHDDRPDINLVILKEWKPTKCVEVNGVRYASGINAKPQINIDVDNDLIPDINIDTDGDFTADINIDQNNNGHLDASDFNITSQIYVWEPDKDSTVQRFTYDTQNDLKAYVNVIVKGTDLPSLNIDLDGDGLPDINIDADGDGIPETNIDIDGDGKADVNLDPDKTGIVQSDPYEITEWKPTIQGKGNGFHFLTMTLDDDKEPEPDNPNDDHLGDKNSDVQGNYYPGDNTGGAKSTSGALTGDTTNIMMYMGFGCMAMGIMLFIIFKKKQS